MSDISKVIVNGEVGSRSLSFSHGDKVMKLELTGVAPVDQEFISEMSDRFRTLASAPDQVDAKQYGLSDKATEGFDILNAHARGCICKLKGIYPQQAIYEFAPEFRRSVDELTERQRAAITPGL